MSVMVLAQKDREIVTEHIRKAFPMLLELSSSNVTSLCYQREILEKIIHQMDKRFEEACEETNRRFEETNRQIKESHEDANRQFKYLLWTIGVGFAAITIATKYL